MQLIAMRDGFIRIKMEPALPALLLRSSVPGNVEGLKAAAG